MNRYGWMILLIGLAIPVMGMARASAADPRGFTGTPIILVNAEEPQGPGAESGERKEKEEEPEEPEELSNLTIGNLFSEGWNERFEEREGADKAVRLPLFGVREGFLTREFVAGYEGEFHADGGEVNRHSLLGGVSLPFNRRFEISFEPAYTWVDRRDAHAANGGTYLTTARLQLIDTETTAVNIGVGVLPPHRDITPRATTMDFALAGWQDLGCRWALSGHIGDELLVGPTEDEEARNRLTYSVALAKTLTPPDACGLANFTVVLESFGETELDGDHSGRTNLLMGPGAFANIGAEKKPLWLSSFIAFPITGPKSSDAALQVTLRKDF